MLKNLFIILAPILMLACASSQQAKPQELEIEQVFQVPGFAKDSLFDGVKIWIAENFKSSKAVLEYENKEDGSLIGNGMVGYPCEGLSCIGQEGNKVLFTMKVEVKDEKFRLSFSNLKVYHPYFSNSVTTISAGENPVWSKGQMSDIKPKLLAFGAQIKASLSHAKEKSNW